MNRKYIVLLSLSLAACLALSGCGAVSGALEGKATAAPSGAAASAANDASAAPDATAAPASGAKEPGFSGAFQLVEKNPLYEPVQIALWLAANTADDPGTQAAGSSAAMKELADKYAAVVDGQGLHYVETADALGMLLTTEYWIKGGKFKKVEKDLGKVTLFDGQHYIQYDTEEKTGKRFAASYAEADLFMLTKGILANMAVSPYQQKDDEKLGDYLCSVFHMDTELSLLGMTIKGNTLYVDKETGLIIKNQSGDPKDKKNSFASVVKSLDVGGFGDEVFAVPDDIVLEDYN